MNTALTKSDIYALKAVEVGEQYSLAKTLGIWASIERRKQHEFK